MGGMTFPYPERTMPKKINPKLSVRIVGDHHKTIQKTRGLKSGCGVTTVMAFLFEINERRPFGSKLTNDGLKNSLFSEFPTRKVLHESVTSNRNGINSMRHAYNLGMINSKIPKPTLISLRYGEDGYPVRSRTGRHYLTKDELVELCYRYRIKDPRVFFDNGTVKDVIDIRIHEEDFCDGSGEEICWDRSG